jgi:hypothetical protein
MEGSIDVDGANVIWGGVTSAPAEPTTPQWWRAPASSQATIANAATNASRAAGVFTDDRRVNSGVVRNGQSPPPGGHGQGRQRDQVRLRAGVDSVKPSRPAAHPRTLTVGRATL